MTSFAYRIRHRVTGEYKLGGIWPHWSKRGKIMVSA